MSGDAKGTFTPVHQILPDPNEPDWVPPEDIPSKEEIKAANHATISQDDSSAMDNYGSKRHPMPTDEISASLRGMLSTLESHIADLNHQGADLFKASSYAAAAEIAEKGKTLTCYLEKVQALHVEWVSIARSVGPSINVQAKSKSSNLSNPRRRSPKKLIVTFDDGTIISENFSKDTFSECVSKIGVLKVQSLGITRLGLPLVSSTKPEKYTSSLIDDLYVVNSFNALDIKSILREINELTGINMEVSIEQ